MRALIGLPLAAFSIAALAAPVRTATDEQNNRCANEDYSLHLSPADVIEACTQIIKLKPTSALEYALAYSNRAVAEDSLGQDDKANADLREAHRIDPADFHATSAN